MRSLLRHGMLGSLLTVKFSLLPSALAPLLTGYIGFPLRRFVVLGGIENLIWALIFFLAGFARAEAIRSSSAMAWTICSLALVVPAGKAVLERGLTRRGSK